jgi:5-methylcytosine-specific restriction endonuclease McrA
MQFCAQPGCPVLVKRGRCAPHAVLRAHTRPNRDTRRWYYRRDWLTLRDTVLTAAAYTCAQCGQITAQLDVDHIVKHNGDPGLFLDRANVQALCKPCHSRKTGHGA